MEPSRLQKKNLTQNQLSEEDLSYASSAVSAILYQSPKGGQKLLWAIMLCVIGLLVWASFAKVDEFTRGQGQVIPSQYLQIVQNLEGGIIAEVFVREGQQVKRDQPLVRLDDKRFSSDLNASESRQGQLIVKSARLLAESEGKPFLRNKLPAEISSGTIDVETELYLKRAEELNNNKQIIEKQITQKRQKLSASRAKASQLARSYDILNQELALTQPLLAKGAASEVEVLRLRRKVNDVKGEMRAAQLAIPSLQTSINESELKLTAIESTFRSQAQSEYNDIQADLSTLKQSSEAIVDRVDRTLVRSPVAGTIKQVFVKTIGGVIQPGNEIVAIVPTEDNLRVEARIQPADIAFLHPEQAATVKITAYDFSIHGGLPGKVVYISPDTIIDRKGNSFYAVQIETERSFLGSKAKPLPIIAGMTVSVDILTGNKTILDYILKPIFKTKELALRER